MQAIECSPMVRRAINRIRGRLSSLAAHRLLALLPGELSVSILNMRRALTITLTGLALAAITQPSYAARDVASEVQVAGLAESSQVAPAPAIAEPHRAGRGTPITLYLEGPNGNAFRLVHVDGIGWRYAEGWKSPDSAAASPLRKVASLSTDPARFAEGPAPDGDPLTVFIDGPSGFAFVWDREGGWKFIGKIADKSR